MPSVGSSGSRIPPGGTAGQVLFKKSDTNFDLQWTTVTIKGDKGDTGETGPTGATGVAGPKGDTGGVGPAGPTGPQGVKGDTGATGLQGPKGDTGLQGLKGDTGTTGLQGAKGDTGATGPGVSTGGTTGQVLTKTSGTDYATSWTTISGLVPTGGTAGQVLTKNSATNYDASWTTASSGSAAAYGNTYASGRWYNQTPMVGTFGAVDVYDTPYYVPTFFSKSVTITTIGLSVTQWNTAAAGRMAILQSDANGLPGTLLSAVVSATPAANGVLNFPYAVTVPAGWHWMAVNCVNTGFWKIVSQSAANASFPLGNTTGPSANAGATCFLSSNTTIVSNPPVSNQTGPCPLLWYKVA